jgi:hypothetical protein
LASSAPGSRLFRICTVFNRAEEYAEMRASFAGAGFDERIARFTGFDNSDANDHDPFSVLSQVCTETSEKYVILCHQDVRLDQADGASQLISRLEELERVDPSWAVAGNAGVDDTAQIVGRITDPHQDLFSAGLPRRVISLDENLLIVRADTRLRCSDGAWGFHLYGTDICLVAQAAGCSCYAIDFHLTHLSGGNASTPEYADALRRLARVWQSRAAVTVACTTTRSWVYASRFALPRYVLQRSHRVRHLALHHPIIRARRGPRLRYGPVRGAAAAVVDWAVANAFALTWATIAVIGRRRVRRATRMGNQ